MFFVPTFEEKRILTRSNCALDRRTILCLYVLGFQRQVFKHDKNLSERSTKMKKKKKNKGSVLVAESAYNSQNTHFGLVMIFTPDVVLIRPDFADRNKSFKQNVSLPH